MIDRVRIENYKALRDVTLELTPLHALIGPNDTGKTSILYALAALSLSTTQPLQRAFLGPWDGRQLVWHGDPKGVVRLSAQVSFDGRELRYSLASRFASAGRNVVVEDETFTLEVETNLAQPGADRTRVLVVTADNQTAPEDVREACSLVQNAIASVHYYRWNPRLLALPTAPDSKRRFRMNADGFGLALFLDDILGYDRKRFDRLEERFRSIFPEIKSIKLVPQQAYRSPPDELEQVSQLAHADGKGIFFEISASGKLVPAAQASDGALLVLGYLTLLHSPEPPRLVLVEEPENGIHPKRLREVIAVLRELVAEQSHTQIVFTTHSPYAVDLLTPVEVTLCTKQPDGSIAVTRLSESKSVLEQRSLFTLGEIWTAEGDQGLAQSATGTATAP